MQQSLITKKTFTLIIITLLSFVVWAHAQKTLLLKQGFNPFLTSSSRTKNVQNYCPQNLNRKQLVSASQLSTARDLKNSLDSQLGINGNTIINQIIRGNASGALESLRGGSVNFSFYLGIVLFPFIVFFISWPFLFCCCCCPSKCCKGSDQNYTKCETQWPAIVLALAFLLIISMGIFGITTASKVNQNFRNMECSLSIFTDDLLNGNVTLSNTSFFIGFNQFAGSLSDLSGNLTGIKSNLTDLSNLTTGNTATDVQNLQNAISSIKTIPDGVGNSQMNLVYNAPINSNTTSNTLGSSFNSILGSWSTSSTLVSNLYLSVQYARAVMSGIKNNSNSFANQVINIQSSTASINTTIQSLITDVENMDNQLGNFMSSLDGPFNFGDRIMSTFYGGLIGISALGLCGLILTACFGKNGCRHLIYLSCFILFLIGTGIFVLGILFSSLVPIFTWTCSYLDVTLADNVGFQSNLNAFLNNITVNQISPCMSFGNGNLIDTIGGNAINGLNNLTAVITDLTLFNNTSLKDNIAINLTALVTSTISYANGDISDLDTVNNNILAGFSNPNNSTNNISCNANFVDSWVPSNNQNLSYSTAILCQSTSGSIGSYSTCDANLQPSATCTGCMDTTQILSRQTNQTALVQALDFKYGPGCAFSTILGNTWSNYYNKKYTLLGYPTAVPQVPGTVMYRMLSSQDLISNISNPNSVFSSIDSFKDSLSNISNGLSSISSLIDPNYGMLAGLNCKVFGQDLQTFQNVICGSFYVSMYNIRLIFVICGWGILFVLFCTVCTGIRHEKKRREHDDDTVIQGQHSLERRIIIYEQQQ